MINLSWIIENPNLFDDAMKLRGCEYRADKIIELDKDRKNKIKELEILQQKRNIISKEIGNLKSQGKDTTALFKEAEDIVKTMDELKIKQDDKKEDELYQILIRIPNILQNDLPVGGENDYKIITTWGEPTKFDFEPKPHYELGESLKQMDFEQSSYIHGGRSTILINNLAKLERALQNYFLDFVEKQGYIEMSMSPLVKESAMFGTGQLPKFAEDAFCTTDGMWLIGTSEITMTNWIANRIIEERELPMRFTASTSCFRSEIGSAGKDVRGMLRQNHFKKVEMVSITTPEESENEHQRMVKIEDKILEELKLPFRTIMLATGDTGFGASKTYDHEVWLPSQNKYREIASCSNCLDFQSRRMGARYKGKSGKTIFPHTLNGSAMAIGRTIIAIMENYQQKDGGIKVPDVLVKYMNGIEII
jgi:seryl-tRNA synthetase